jgi:hypothetical protein
MHLKLLVFAPCEKHIISAEKTASLISVIEGLKIELGEPLPDDASLPMKWSIVSLWHRVGEAEPDTRFQQRVEVIAPKGTTIATVEQGFPVSNENQNYRNIAEILGFPIQDGEMLLRLSLRQRPEQEWEQVAEYPVSIFVTVKEQVPTEIANAEQTTIT